MEDQVTDRAPLQQDDALPFHTLDLGEPLRMRRCQNHPFSMTTVSACTAMRREANRCAVVQPVKATHSAENTAAPTTDMDDQTQTRGANAANQSNHRSRRTGLTFITGIAASKSGYSCPSRIALCWGSMAGSMTRSPPWELAPAPAGPQGFRSPACAGSNCSSRW